MNNLIEMIKGEEMRLVHPSNIRAFQRQGWARIEPPVVSPILIEDAPAVETVVNVKPKRVPSRRSHKKAG
jgi:hypothetical protein